MTEYEQIVKHFGEPRYRALEDERPIWEHQGKLLEQSAMACWLPREAKDADPS